MKRVLFILCLFSLLGMDYCPSEEDRSDVTSTILSFIWFSIVGEVTILDDAQNFDESKYNDAVVEVKTTAENCNCKTTAELTAMRLDGVQLHTRFFNDNRGFSCDTNNIPWILRVRDAGDFKLCLVQGWDIE